jgi:drug/metabolite transporter (DMT)-like permease
VQSSHPFFALSIGLCGGVVAATLVQGRGSVPRPGPARALLSAGLLETRSMPVEDLDAVFKRVDEEAEQVQRDRERIEELRAELEVRMKNPSYTKAQVAQLRADEAPAVQNGNWVERAFDGMDMMAVRGCMVAITMVWGINFPVMKLAMDSLDGADATLFTAARFGLAAGSLLPFLGGASKPVLMAGAQVGALVAGGYGCQTAALAMGTEASKASFICSLNVLVVAIGSALRSGSISRKTLLACALAITGVGFLEMPGLENGFGFNDLLAFGQPIGFGLSYLRMERVMKEHPNDALSLSAMQCLMVFLASGSAAMVGSDGFTAPWDLSWAHLLSPEVLACMVFCGLIATSLTIWLQSIIFARLPAMEASIILTSEPLWATLFAVLLVGEHVGMVEGVGGALIIAACVVNVLPASKPQDAAEEDIAPA